MLTLEELQEKFVELQEKYTALENDFNNQKEQLTLVTTNNEELKTLNQKLFLRVTSEDIREDKKEDNIEIEIKEYLGDKVYNVLDKRDRKLLNDIIEGDD